MCVLESYTIKMMPNKIQSDITIKEYSRVITWFTFLGNKMVKKKFTVSQKDTQRTLIRIESNWTCDIFTVSVHVSVLFTCGNLSHNISCFVCRHWTAVPPVSHYRWHSGNSRGGRTFPKPGAPKGVRGHLMDHVVGNIKQHSFYH